MMSPLRRFLFSSLLFVHVKFELGVAKVLFFGHLFHLYGDESPL